MCLCLHIRGLWKFEPSFLVDDVTPPVIPQTHHWPKNAGMKVRGGGGPSPWLRRHRTPQRPPAPEVGSVFTDLSPPVHPFPPTENTGYEQNCPGKYFLSTFVRREKSNKNAK